MMKRKLVFATNNAHKLEEVAAILGDQVELLSLNDISCQTDIPETAENLPISIKTIIWIVLPMIQDWKWKP